MASILQPVVAFAIIALQVTTTSLMVGFATRNSLLRPGGLPITLLAAYSQLSEARIQHPVPRPFAAAASVFLALMYVDTVLLSRWTFDANGPTSTLGGLDPTLRKSDHDTLGEKDPTGEGEDSTEGPEAAEEPRSRGFAARLRFGFSIALQGRFPCTPWGVKHTRGFDRSDIPSREAFVRSVGICKMAICTLILWTGRPSGDPGQNCVLFSPYEIPMFGNIIDPTADWSNFIEWERLRIRTLNVHGYMAVQGILISLLYDLSATLAVALRITDVEAWPPLFGRLDEAWSLRQFWGEHQHQLLRRGCSSIAHFITPPFLRLPRESLAGRYLFMSLVFAASSVFFLLADIAIGIPVRESGAVVFFCWQVPAIMIEDLALATAKRVAVSWGIGVTRNGEFSVDRLPPKVRLAIRAIGCGWVIMWLTWMSPVWIYPAMERDTGEPIVPF